MPPEEDTGSGSRTNDTPTPAPVEASVPPAETATQPVEASVPPAETATQPVTNGGTPSAEEIAADAAPSDAASQSGTHTVFVVNLNSLKSAGSEADPRP